MRPVVRRRPLDGEPLPSGFQPSDLMKSPLFERQRQEIGPDESSGEEQTREPSQTASLVGRTRAIGMPTAQLEQALDKRQVILQDPNSHSAKFVQEHKALSASQNPQLRALPKIPQTPSSTGLDLVSMSKQTITVKKLLTGKEAKPVVLLEIGGEKYVLKAGDFGEMEDHITNSDLFNRAKISGVDAPRVKELTGDFRKAFISQLKTQNLDTLGANFDLEDSLITALTPTEKKDVQAMISDFVEGSPVTSFLDYQTRGVMEDLVAAVQTSKNSKSAVLALQKVLLKDLGSTQIKKLQSYGQPPRDLLRELTQDDPAKRKGAIDLLKQNLQNLSLSQLTLEWMGKVNDRSPKEVLPDVQGALQKLVDQQEPLISYVKTQQGAAALAGLMTIDLIVGMDDRLVKAFNGDNFYFDPKNTKLWCIDNAKMYDISLSCEKEGTWQDWVRTRSNMRDDNTDSDTDKGKSFAEIFHWTVYSKQERNVSDFQHSVKLSDTEADETASAMRKAVDDSLKTLQDLVDDGNNGLPKNVRDRLKGRLAFVDARNQLSSLLDFNEFKEVPSVDNPWFGQKLARKALRKTTIKPATTEQVNAEAWKNKARNPLTTDKELDDQDQEISDYLANNPQPDRRVLKALFATRAERLVRVLKQRTDPTSEDLNIGNVAALAKSNKAWGKFDASVINSLTAIANNWKKTLTANGDPETAKRVDEAMKAFTQQFAAQLT